MSIFWLVILMTLWSVELFSVTDALITLNIRSSNQIAGEKWTQRVREIGRTGNIKKKYSLGNSLFISKLWKYLFYPLNAIQETFLQKYNKCFYCYKKIVTIQSFESKFPPCTLTWRKDVCILTLKFEHYTFSSAKMVWRREYKYMCLKWPRSSVKTDIHVWKILYHLKWLDRSPPTSFLHSKHVNRFSIRNTPGPWVTYTCIKYSVLIY